MEQHYEESSLLLIFCSYQIIIKFDFYSEMKFQAHSAASQRVNNYDLMCAETGMFLCNFMDRDLIIDTLFGRLINFVTVHLIILIDISVYYYFTPLSHCNDTNLITIIMCQLLSLPSNSPSTLLERRIPYSESGLCPCSVQ